MLSSFGAVYHLQLQILFIRKITYESNNIFKIHLIVTEGQNCDLS